MTDKYQILHEIINNYFKTSDSKFGVTLCQNFDVILGLLRSHNVLTSIFAASSTPSDPNNFPTPSSGGKPLTQKQKGKIVAAWFRCLLSPLLSKKEQSALDQGEKGAASLFKQREDEEFIPLSSEATENPIKKMKVENVWDAKNVLLILLDETFQHADRPAFLEHADNTRQIATFLLAEELHRQPKARLLDQSTRVNAPVQKKKNCAIGSCCLLLTTLFRRALEWPDCARDFSQKLPKLAHLQIKLLKLDPFLLQRSELFEAVQQGLKMYPSAYKHLQSDLEGVCCSAMQTHVYFEAAPSHLSLQSISFPNFNLDTFPSSSSPSLRNALQLLAHLPLCAENGGALWLDLVRKIIRNMARVAATAFPSMETASIISSSVTNSEHENLDNNNNNTNSDKKDNERMIVSPFDVPQWPYLASHLATLADALLAFFSTQYPPSLKCQLPVHEILQVALRLLSVDSKESQKAWSDHSSTNQIPTPYRLELIVFCKALALQVLSRLVNRLGRGLIFQAHTFENILAQHFPSEHASVRLAGYRFLDSCVGAYGVAMKTVATAKLPTLRADLGSPQFRVPACRLLDGIFMKLGSVIAVQTRDDIDRTLVQLAQDFLQVSTHSISENEFGVSLFSAIFASVISPNRPTQSPILSQTLTVFSDGQRHGHSELARLCARGLAICEALIHPRMPPLNLGIFQEVEGNSALGVSSLHLGSFRNVPEIDPFKVVTESISSSMVTDSHSSSSLELFSADIQENSSKKKHKSQKSEQSSSNNKPSPIDKQPISVDTESEASRSNSDEESDSGEVLIFESWVTNDPAPSSPRLQNKQLNTPPQSNTAPKQQPQVTGSKPISSQPDLQAIEHSAVQGDCFESKPVEKSKAVEKSKVAEKTSLPLVKQQDKKQHQKPKEDPAEEFDFPDLLDADPDSEDVSDE